MANGKWQMADGKTKKIAQKFHQELVTNF